MFYVRSNLEKNTVENLWHMDDITTNNKTPTDLSWSGEKSKRRNEKKEKVKVNQSARCDQLRPCNSPIRQFCR
ncbi:hypothetical protein RB195_003538 [Necator americanus]|uniref:Uncharacterized protein n=1 Tax=Necator americanus TaxID=51031 RepID=A0ABR1DP16_NECAM